MGIANERLDASRLSALCMVKSLYMQASLMSTRGSQARLILADSTRYLLSIRGVGPRPDNRACQKISINKSWFNRPHAASVHRWEFGKAEVELSEVCILETGL